MTTNPYAQFMTSPDLERTGVIVDYGPFRVRLARAGGANKRYEKILEQKFKPYRRQVQTETMDLELANKLILECFAEAVLLGWEVQTGEKDANGEPLWQTGIHDLDTGTVLPANPANYMKVLSDVRMHDVMRDIREQAGKAALFRAEILEADGKN